MRDERCITTADIAGRRDDRLRPGLQRRAEKELRAEETAEVGNARSPHPGSSPPLRSPTIWRKYRPVNQPSRCTPRGSDAGHFASGGATCRRTSSTRRERPCKAPTRWSPTHAASAETFAASATVSSSSGREAKTSDGGSPRGSHPLPVVLRSPARPDAARRARGRRGPAAVKLAPAFSAPRAATEMDAVGQGRSVWRPTKRPPA